MSPPHAAITSAARRLAERVAHGDVRLHRRGRDRFECRLDGGAWTTCTSPHAIGGLADGGHTFDVRAVWQGQAETTPETRTWTVDATAPDTTIADGPAADSLTTQREAAFRFTSEAGATFECRLDAGPWAGCGSPRALQALSDGGHRFDVRARDEAGNVDGSPATRAWTVDATAPDTALEGGPAEGLDGRRSGRDVRIRERAGRELPVPRRRRGLDVMRLAGDRRLGDGGHAFEVRASDAAGNADESPARRTWTVDVTPPDTRGVRAGRGLDERRDRGDVGFASEPGAGFECRLDGGPWIACGPSQAYSGLAVGGHRFEVRAHDAVGNVDGSPAARGWTVVAGSPAPC